MNPREFQELAEELAHGKRPAELRSAISRAYYAAYLVAVETLRGMSFRISKGSAGHAEVQRCLFNSGDPALAKIGSDLSDFRRTRNLADYDPGDKSVEEQAKAVVYVAMARKIIQALDTCQAEPQRSRIIAGINAYLKKLEP